jgi:alpha-L-arabinofuranosidase
MLSGAGERFFYSVTKSPKKLCLKLVNASSTEQPLSIAFNGAGQGALPARMNTLKANSVWATNSIQYPERIVPVKSTTSIRGARMQHVMPGYSIQVVEVDLK